jgi:hypothetical protein
MPLPGLSRRRCAVLALYRDRAVWIEPTAGGPRIGTAPCAPEDPAALAAAALAARSAADGRAGRCVLALGEPWIALGFVALPPLSDGERRAVLARKAATLAPRPEPLAPDAVLFAAAHAAPDAGAARGTTDAAEPERWLTAALERRRLEDLVRALERAGCVPQRVVSARLAALARRAESNEGVRLLALRDPDGTALALCTRGALLQLGTLAHGTPAALATALLQEARTHAACARRTLRGAFVSGIDLVGFEPDEAATLETRLASALGTTCASEGDGAGALHAELLAGAFGHGPLRLDLLPPRIRRPRRVALYALAALAATLSIAAVTSVELARARRELGAKLRALQQASGRDARREESERGLPETIAALEREVARIEAARGAARSFGDALAGLATAVDGAASIATLELDPGRLRATGTADPRPFVALAALEDVRRALLAQGAADVRLAPPTVSTHVAPRDPAAAAGQAFVLDVERAP